MSSTETSTGLGSYTGILMLVVFFAIMWLLVIRPQNKKEKEQKNMRNNLEVGDDILTIGGFYGKVVKIREDRITIACGADKVKLEITKSAISQVLKDDKDADKKSKKDEAAAKEIADEVEAEKKVTPKKLKKLGKDAEPAEEAVAPAAEAAAPVEEAAPAEEAPKAE